MSKRKPQKAKDRFVTARSGPKTYSGHGIHKDRRTKRQRTRAAQLQSALREW